MKPIKNEYKTETISLGAGENTFGSPFSISENESRYSRNLSGDNYPAAHVRPGRTSYLAAVDNIYAIGERNNEYLHVVTGKPFTPTARVTLDTADSIYDVNVMATATKLYYTYLQHTAANGMKLYHASMNLNGTSFTSVSLATATGLDNVRSFLLGTKIYSVCFYTTTMVVSSRNLDGTGYASATLNISTLTATEVTLSVVGTTIYIAFSNTAKISVGTLATDLTGWVYATVYTATIANCKHAISDSKWYFAFNEGGALYTGENAQVITAECATAGTGWASKTARTSTGTNVVFDLAIVGTDIYIAYQTATTKVNIGKITTAWVGWAVTQIYNGGETTDFIYHYMWDGNLAYADNTLYLFTRTGEYRDGYSGASLSGQALITFKTDISNVILQYGLTITNTEFSKLSSSIYNNILYCAWREGWYHEGNPDNYTGNYILGTGNFNDCVWKYYTNPTTPVTVESGFGQTNAKIIDFATGTTKYTILMNGTEKMAWDGTAVTDLTAAPFSDKTTSHSGRLYAARDNDIMYSALNKIDDWTTANDAGTIDVTNAKGNISAIKAYDGYVTVWTENSMHVLTGTGPPDYDLREVNGGVGCISDRSVAIGSNGVLYWAWYDGLYGYSGGKAVKVSQKADEYFKNINKAYKEGIDCGVKDDKIFISIPYGSTATGNNLVLEFDTTNGRWYPWAMPIKGFVTIGNTLYGVDMSNVIWTMDTGKADGATAIAWSWISGPMLKKSLKDKKMLEELTLLFKLPVGSTLNVSVSNSIDSDNFDLIAAYTSTGGNQTRTALPYNKIASEDYYRLKFDGTGPCDIYALEQRYRVG